MKKNGFLKRIKDVSIVNVVVFLVGFLGLVACYPTVEKQFLALEKPGDVIVNVCIDLAIIIVYVFLIWIIAGLLRKFKVWFENFVKQ